MDVALPNSSALTGSVLQTLLCVTVEMIAETPLTRSTVAQETSLVIPKMVDVNRTVPLWMEL